MKNIIPLITAVLLGLAAIFAVSKTVKHNEKPDERMRDVLIVTGEIMPGELIQESRIGVKAVPESAAPKNSIDESNRAFTFNQRAKRKISPGDYILYSDIELDQSTCPNSMFVLTRTLMTWSITTSTMPRMMSFASFEIFIA